MLMVAILSASEARAAGKESKDRAAKTACMSGDYAKGVALLAELFVSTGEAIYIFNQGRCFEQSGRYEEAIVRFREYQRKNADLKRPPDPEADKHIADCQELLDRQKPATPATPATPPPETKPAAETPPPAPLPLVPAASEAPATETPADLLVQPNADEPAPEGKPFYKTWWFWTSVGAVVVAGSVTAFLLARRTPNACDGLDIACVGVEGNR